MGFQVLVDKQQRIINLINELKGQGGAWVT